ncbi:MAG: HD domain-containing protein [Firmicutes bacterium]|nr:HD domain-containing protein [Bacillota bacterium]
MTLEDIKQHPKVEAFIRQGNTHLGALGFTEHGFRHANLVATIARQITQRLGYGERQGELAAIAGYLHDIGNVISRQQHGQTGAMITMQILESMGMEYEEIAAICAAIGNHEEEYGEPVNQVAAALILADKSDVHRSRVRNTDVATYDIHDRVNYAATHSFLRVDEEARTITLEITIDSEVSSIMDYFEIFLTRMIMCRRAATTLDATFSIVINDSKLL